MQLSTNINHLVENMDVAQKTALLEISDAVHTTFSLLCSRTLDKTDDMDSEEEEPNNLVGALLEVSQSGTKDHHETNWVVDLVQKSKQVRRQDQ